MNGQSTIELIRSRLRQYRDLGRAAIDQLDDKELHWSPDPDSNSISIIIQHMAGNARSRFTDFLTTDGEKPDRDRDSEFIEKTVGRDNVLALWDRGWFAVFSALDPLTDEDLSRTVTIRNEEHSVLDAALRQLAHYAYHIGQIVYLAKMIKQEDWRTLSIPRGQSAKYLATPFTAAL
jgi:hypothetical protein